MKTRNMSLIIALAKSGRIEVIRALRQFPERDFSVNELARTARIPVMSCWRAVSELTSLGVVSIRKVANSHIVKLSSTPELLRLLRQIPDTDPHRFAALLVAERISDLPGMTEARLFGRVAKGDHAPDSEVDMAVVIDQMSISEEDAAAHVNRAVDEVEELTGVRISPHLVRRDHLEQGRGFAAELRDKEIIWRRSS